MKGKKIFAINVFINFIKKDKRKSFFQFYFTDYVGKVGICFFPQQLPSINFAQSL